MDLDQESRELKRALDRAPRNSRGHRDFAEELRHRVVAFVTARTDAGGSMAAAGRELGLAQRTVWTWMRERQGVVREVEVVDEPRKRAPTPQRELRVVLRSGAVIEGLDIEQAIAFARALP